MDHEHERDAMDRGGDRAPPPAFVPYDPHHAVAMREAPTRRRSANGGSANRASHLRSMLGVSATDSDSDHESAVVHSSAPKRRRVALNPGSVGARDGSHEAPSRPPPEEDTRVAEEYVQSLRQNHSASSEEVSEIRGPLPWHEWRAGSEYVHPAGRDPRFFQIGDDPRQFLTERKNEFCFACTLSGDFAAVHAATLAEIWKSAIESYPLMRAAAMVSAYYEENMRLDTEHKQSWDVLSVFEHYTSHEINAHTATVQAIRDHVVVANHQLYLLNSRGPNGLPTAPDPALVSAWMKTNAAILRLHRELNG